MLAVSSLLVLLICNLVLVRYRAGLNREYNQALASLEGSVIESYPDTPVDSLIQVLNGQGGAESGEQLLRQYGIFVGNGSSAFAAQAHRTGGLQWEMNLLLAALAAVLTGTILFYLSRRVGEGNVSPVMPFIACDCINVSALGEVLSSQHCLQGLLRYAFIQAEARLSGIHCQGWASLAITPK